VLKNPTFGTNAVWLRVAGIFTAGAAIHHAAGTKTNMIIADGVEASSRILTMRNVQGVNIRRVQRPSPGVRNPLQNDFCRNVLKDNFRLHLKDSARPFFIVIIRGKHVPKVFTRLFQAGHATKRKKRENVVPHVAAFRTEKTRFS
jgi:hypothetical protein